MNNEKLQKLSFSELYNILDFLRYELKTGDGSEKEILINRISIIEEELKRKINNLF
jgi:hypothetical protein